MEDSSGYEVHSRAGRSDTRHVPEVILDIKDRQVGNGTKEQSQEVEEEEGEE